MTTNHSPRTWRQIAATAIAAGAMAVGALALTAPAANAATAFEQTCNAKGGEYTSYRNGWDLKELCKTIDYNETYEQGYPVYDQNIIHNYFLPTATQVGTTPVLSEPASHTTSADVAATPVLPRGAMAPHAKHALAPGS